MADTLKMHQNDVKKINSSSEYVDSFVSDCLWHSFNRRINDLFF